MGRGGRGKGHRRNGALGDGIPTTHPRTKGKAAAADFARGVFVEDDEPATGELSGPHVALFCGTDFTNDIS